MGIKNTANSPENQIISYLKLRKSIGWLGILLPFVLLIGNFLIFIFEDSGNPVSAVQSSISDYYYTRMGVIFVGILCAVALFLFCYIGDNKIDSMLSNLAGGSALGVVLFPTSENPDKYANWYGPTGGINVEIIHLLFAASFFLILAYMSYFIFTASENRRNSDLMHRRNKLYRVCGLIIAISLLLMAIDVILPNDIIGWLNRYKPIYVLETFALIAFGISWLVKGEFLLKENQNPTE